MRAQLPLEWGGLPCMSTPSHLPLILYTRTRGWCRPVKESASRIALHLITTPHNKISLQQQRQQQNNNKQQQQSKQHNHEQTQPPPPQQQHNNNYNNNNNNIMCTVCVYVCDACAMCVWCECVCVCVCVCVRVCVCGRTACNNYLKSQLTLLARAKVDPEVIECRCTQCYQVLPTRRA